MRPNWDGNDSQRASAQNIDVAPLPLSRGGKFQMGRGFKRPGFCPSFALVAGRLGPPTAASVEEAQSP